MTPHTQANCDSRDCGSFFLDVFGTFAQKDVAVHWSDQRRASNPQVDQTIEQVWQEHTHQAAVSGRRLYNGQLGRLVSYTPDAQSLELNLGPVTFKEFLGTNLTLARLRYLHGPEVLADPLGVSAALVSSDNYLLLGRRSQQVAFHAGRLHPLGGILEVDDTRKPDPFALMRRELAQEASLGADRIAEIVCIALVRDKQIVQPELVFDVTATADADTLRRQARTASESFEHTELVPVRGESSCVLTFIQQNLDDLTPVAVATLLVHGMRRWGTGWFAAARGYLRKVI